MVISLSFRWRHLLFVNWPVDSEYLSMRLPDGVDVQEYDGTGWVTLISFLNVNVRPRGLPAGVGLDVPEVNLRTYVTRDDEPGVYFFSLDAQDLLTVIGGRMTHHLPYYYARGEFNVEDTRVRFESRRSHPGDPPARFSATYQPTGKSFTPEPGSRAEFLTERRRLFTRAQDGTYRYTDIEHERWTLYAADAVITENTLFGANVTDHLRGEPVFYYSPGLDVTTARSKRWSRTTD